MLPASRGKIAQLLPKTPTPGTDASDRRRRQGFAYGLLAYGCWGVFPVYLKAVARTPVLEVLCHRVVWALALLAAIAWWQDGLADVRQVLRRPRTVAALCASTVLIAVNWLVYIYAVVQGRMLEASLGYYVNPLVNVLLGVLILHERLQRLERVAVALAAAGMLWLALHLGQPPWIPLALAASFGLYGLVRKVAPVGALAGLTVETLLLVPFALGTLAWKLATARAVFLSGDTRLDVLLVLAGPLTAFPLLCFAAAARRLPLSTLGFIQYVSPTLQFLLAVLVYGEPFRRAQAGAFAFIWAALALFAYENAWRTRAAGRAEPTSEATG
jgi:chloramphenicol-sensitive protein RarD